VSLYHGNVNARRKSGRELTFFSREPLLMRQVCERVSQSTIDREREREREREIVAAVGVGGGGSEEEGKPSCAFIVHDCTGNEYSIRFEYNRSFIEIPCRLHTFNHKFHFNECLIEERGDFGVCVAAFNLLFILY
jgi:hypothetical protein